MAIAKKITTAEGNEKIALFLGWKYNSKDYNWRTSRIANATWIDANRIGHYNLSFNLSWDRLMPVIKKLDRLAEDKIIKFSDEYEQWCDKLDAAVTRNYEIKETWECVVNFIDWLNTQT